MFLCTKYFPFYLPIKLLPHV
uniref:Uncharacterized protein n=1 Tax=Arundo donax TaxID=35708 RepID=A0A0A9CBV7_ARUDO